MKNNQVAALFFGMALMVGVVVAKDVSSERVVLSNDTIKAASAELVQILHPVFDAVKILQKNIADKKTVVLEEFLQFLNNVAAQSTTPVLSTLPDEAHQLIALNLLRAALDELLIAKKLVLPEVLINDITPAWLSEECWKKAQQRFAEDLDSGKMQFIGAMDILGKDLFRRWLSLLDMQDSAEVDAQNIFVLLENFGAMLGGVVSCATIKISDVPGDRSLGVVLDMRGGMDAMKLVAHWQEATSEMKFTKGEIDLLYTFLTKILPEEMPKMIAASPLATFKPSTQEDVCLCIEFLSLFYKTIEMRFLNAHFSGQKFTSQVVDGKLAE